MFTPPKIAGAALATALVSFAAAVSPAGAAVLIRNHGSGLCAAVRGLDAAAIGATVTQQRCTGSPAQQWTPLDSGDYRRFRNGLTGMCLDVGTPIDANPSAVRQSTCAAARGMYWKALGGLPATVPAQVRSAIDGRCLDVERGSPEEGAIVQIAHCDPNNPAQAWTLTGNY